MKLFRSLMVAAALAISPVAMAQTTPLTPANPAAKPVDKPAGQPAMPATATKPGMQPEGKPADTTTTPPSTTATEKLVFVKMTTSKGDMILELNNDKAPISTKNFLSYVDDNYYDGLIFHRVIDGFMIQGGGFSPDMVQKKTKDPIKNEWKNGLKNAKYTVAMARTSIIDSATSQFFINVTDNKGLDEARDGAAYAVFGKVVSGTDVVDKIKSVKTGDKNGMQNVPIETITITKVVKLSEEEAKKAMK